MSTYTIYSPLPAAQTDIAIPEPYISQADVEIWVRAHVATDDGTFVGTQLSQGADYTWLSGGQIRLTTPADGATDYLVKRNTQRDPLTTQQPGVFSSSKINLVIEQQQYVNEEQDDLLSRTQDAAAALASRVASLESGLDGTLLGASALATETITSGSFVNLYWATSQLCVRNASALDPTKWAWGFVEQGGAGGNTLTARLLGLNSVLLPPAFGEVFLSDTVPGSYTLTPPSATGSIVQPLGLAVPSRGIFFTPQPRILL